ncbi:putative nucleolar GTP-binding protein 2 isoform X2 [Apostichopus japonicus]|uniref:Nucleolar GTP-binding protein 2 n=1 Tax=Stichopus japonicus TaxID=307972 RepID=A0A2G8JQ27_STIJA|nr:putative nucleolar GTP-binding protein 2 isoform X2 [Apostichopus japonicus]
MSKTVKRRKKRDFVSKANHSMNPDRPKGAGGNNARDKATIKRLRMYKSGKPTRVITQTALQTFQEEMGKALKDPYKVVMRQTKLPITLLQERAKHQRVHVLDTESFETTFGPKRKRKRVNLKVADIQDLVSSVEKSHDSYSEEKDSNIVVEYDGFKDAAKEPVMAAGQSKRIWGELYKVIDSSDVLLQVLDARDPMGTRSKFIENYLRKDKPHKHLMFVLNKVDLVPTWVTKRWVAILSSEYPTLAFHASVKNPFGKGALIQLLRQFSKLHCDKRQISVGFIGYPNVGKSSVINTLRSKKVCNVAPIAGETKVWQYITLMKRIYLIDCPGVVYPTGETEAETVLKGVVRVENIKAPEDYITDVLARVKPDYMKKTYRIDEWKDTEDFLEQLAARTGKLLKKGEPDISTVAKMVLNDWQRGKIPFFVKPPNCEKILLRAGTREEAIIGLSKSQADRSQSLSFIFNVHDFELSIVDNSVTGRHTLILE